MPEKCKGTVWEAVSHRHYPCNNSATCEDGYCKKHSPTEGRRKQEARQADIEVNGPRDMLGHMFWLRDQRIKALEAENAELRKELGEIKSHAD